MSDNSKKPTTALQKTAKSLWHAVVLGLTFSLASVVSFAQTASYHDHNIFHGAGTAFVNTSPQAQAVGDGGVLRAQLIWQVTPGQTKGADLDIHAKLPNGTGPYTVTQFDPVGALPGTPQKTPPFGNPNTASDGNQQVNWVNRQVVFSSGQAVASLDQDNRTGVANSPSGALVENIYIKGATAANPNNIPSGTYQFAVHNYNQTKLANPEAAYALWITTNGKVGVRSEGHYRGTGQEPGSPGLPVYVGTLTSEGQSSRIYEIDIVNPDHDPHAPGVTVVDAKRRYLNAWHAEQARLAEIRRQAALAHQAMAERTASQNDARIDWGGCPPPMVCQPSFLNANSTPAMLAWTDTNALVAGFKKQNAPQLDAASYQNNVLLTGAGALLIQPVKTPTDSEIASKALDDGRLTFEEANAVYRTNTSTSTTLTVDAGKLNVMATSKFKWNEKTNSITAEGVVTGFGPNGDYWIHGQNIIRKRDDGTYGLYQGTYDFDIKDYAFYNPMQIRNLGAVVGETIAGSGVEYEIGYSGNVNLVGPIDGNGLKMFGFQIIKPASK